MSSGSATEFPRTQFKIGDLLRLKDSVRTHGTWRPEDPACWPKYALILANDVANDKIQYLDMTYNLVEASYGRRMSLAYDIVAHSTEDEH